MSIEIPRSVQSSHPSGDEWFAKVKSIAAVAQNLTSRARGLQQDDGYHDTRPTNRMTEFETKQSTYSKPANSAKPGTKAGPIPNDAPGKQHKPTTANRGRTQENEPLLVRIEAQSDPYRIVNVLKHNQNYSPTRHTKDRRTGDKQRERTREHDTKAKRSRSGSTSASASTLASSIETPVKSNDRKQATVAESRDEPALPQTTAPANGVQLSAPAAVNQRSGTPELDRSTTLHFRPDVNLRHVIK